MAYLNAATLYEDLLTVFVLLFALVVWSRRHEHTDYFKGILRLFQAQPLTNTSESSRVLLFGEFVFDK
jgi:hypothetical protein